MNRTAKTLAVLALAIASIGAAKPKEPAPKCELVKQGDRSVYAKRTEAGNYSVTACEAELIIRFTYRTQTFQVQPKSVTMRKCLVWVNPTAPTSAMDAGIKACQNAMEDSHKP